MCLQYLGAILLDGLKDLEKRYKYIFNARGRGTFCAFDCTSSEARDEMVELLKKEGIQSGGAGPLAIRLRPSLVFQPNHAAIFLDKLEKVLKSKM